MFPVLHNNLAHIFDVFFNVYLQVEKKKTLKVSHTHTHTLVCGIGVNFLGWGALNFLPIQEAYCNLTLFHGCNLVAFLHQSW